MEHELIKVLEERLSVLEGQNAILREELSSLQDTIRVLQMRLESSEAQRNTGLETNDLLIKRLDALEAQTAAPKRRP